MRDVCDVAYVLLVEQVERQATADWQAAAFARAFSGEGELPSLTAHAAAQTGWLDEALSSEPVPAGVDDQQTRLRRALGVGV